MYRIGIDAGSKTIKLVVIDENGEPLHYIYKRHSSNIKKTLGEVLDEYLKRYGNAIGYAAVTGSAGISVAQILGLPFVQEVIATTDAVRASYPQADAIIELGGEDAKVVYLDKPIEQRMNATCAGGTGGFIDTIAEMMGIKTSEMNMYAQQAKHVYPIASRCAVFAQSDVNPLLTNGTSKEDIAASVLEAVVKQTIGGLACGRPIHGKVVFLGGPLEYIPDLCKRFRKALDLTEETGIKPHRANVFTARGAAIGAGKAAKRELESGKKEPSNLTSISNIRQIVLDVTEIEDDLTRLEPLFTSEQERRAFDERHRGEIYPRASLSEATGPLYLGLDMGSAAVKYALVDSAGRLLSYDARDAEGDALNIADDMLDTMYARIPQNGSAYIAQAAVTGHGNEILQSALKLDMTVVDMAAHARAVHEFAPEADFVLDIGGQDTKGIWVHEGQIVDAILNEPCASGYGSFIQSTAQTLGCSQEEFSEKALKAGKPVELDTKCTVFMTSKVRHAQKVGASDAEISAGIAYSVAQNALYRVIGRSENAGLGKAVVVTGGAFKSDAVLRAFEKVAGVEVKRPDVCELMGAIGAALIARDAADAERAAQARAGKKHPIVTSDLISAEHLATIDPVYSTWACTGCAEACMLSIADFRDNRVFVSGNRCRKAAQIVKEEMDKLPVGEHLGRTSLIPRSKASQRSQTDAELGGGIVIPGYMRSFSGGMVGGGGTVGGEWISDYLGAAPFNREIRAKPDAKFTRHWGKERDDVKDEAADLPRQDFTVEVSEKNIQAQEGAVPNLIVRERELLASYADYVAPNACEAATIGIVNTLNVYDQLPFWHALFAHLGYSVVVSDSEKSSDLKIKASESIPSESVCEAAKITHERVYDLARRGADVLFLPRYERAGGCAVRCEYADAVIDNVPFIESGEVKVLAPTLAATQAAAMDQADARRLYESLQGAFDATAPDWETFEAALRAAREAQEQFLHELEEDTRAALSWIEAEEGRHGILLACRPYHVDVELTHDIDNVLEKLGFAVLNPLGIPALRGFASQEAQRVRDWPAAERLLSCVDYVLDNERLDLAIVQSFNCGFDAVSIGDARRRLVNAGRPFTVLKVDEIADPAHIIARLKTMASSIEARKAAALPDIAEKSAGQVLQEPRGSESVQLLADGMSRLDLENARANVPPDMCFTAAAIVAHAMSKIEDDPEIGELHVPPTCKSCLIDALPHLLRRRFGFTPEIVWDGTWDAKVPPALRESAGEHEGVRIGIVGNPLLCFDPFMNEGIVDKLEGLGIEPLLPDPALVETDDVRYFEQLQKFSDEGAKSVLYLQNFSCLKGHVRARGALHEMARRFPDMPVTVLDYDPESSALNRENRIRLVVSAAKGE